MEDIVSRLRTLNFMGPWAEAADEIERLREALETFANNVKETNEGIDENWSKTIYPLKAENQRLREEIALLNSMIQTEHTIIRAALKEVK